MDESAAAQQIATPSHRRFTAGMLLAGVGAALVAVAYFGTEIYNYYIPNIAGRQDFSLGLAVVSVVGGIAALLSPCAFGMLPGYFAFFLSARTSEGQGSSVARTMGLSMRYGAATAAGMTLAGAILAVLIGLIGEAFAPDLRVVTSDPNDVTQAIRLIAGVLLVSLGAAHIRGLGLPWSAAATDRLRTRTDRPILWFFAYGLLYILVALPCTANLMAAPLLYGLGTGGTDLAAAAAGLFLATMAAMSMVVALLVGLSKDAVLRQFQLSARHIQTVAALLFVAVGLALIYLNLDVDLFRRTFFDFPIKE